MDENRYRVVFVDGLEKKLSKMNEVGEIDYDAVKEILKWCETWGKQITSEQERRLMNGN
jgi:hemerythrin-like domain-containing protein